MLDSHHKYYSKKIKTFLSNGCSNHILGFSQKKLFQKLSVTVPADSSSILLVKVFQIRRCSTRKQATITTFARVILKAAKYKLTRKRKRKFRAIVVRSQRYFRKIWGLTYTFSLNNLVLLKKRMNSVGKEIYGPTSKELKIKKFRIAFRFVY